MGFITPGRGALGVAVFAGAVGAGYALSSGARPDGGTAAPPPAMFPQGAPPQDLLDLNGQRVVEHYERGRNDKPVLTDYTRLDITMARPAKSFEHAVDVAIQLGRDPVILQARDGAYWVARTKSEQADGSQKQLPDGEAREYMTKLANPRVRGYLEDNMLVHRRGPNGRPGGTHQTELGALELVRNLEWGK